MERNNLYPLFLKVKNLEVLIIGGGIVAEEKLGGIETSIDVSAYAPSSYSLVLRNENQEKVKTFKLVKTH